MCLIAADGKHQRFLKAHNLVCSMSAVGSFDNAVVESFFGLLKQERVNRRWKQFNKHPVPNVFHNMTRIL